MSKGPGALQKRILDELAEEAGGRLPWRRLRERFPKEVRQKSFYRAVRSLRRAGRILDFEAAHGPVPGGRCRYIAVVPVYEAGGRLHFAYEADRELSALTEQAVRQLKTLAAARGIRPEPPHKGPSEATLVGTYRREEI